MTAEPQNLSFATSYQRLSGAERDFCDQFTKQISAQAARLGLERCTVLDRLPGSGVEFDWRTREFLALERMQSAIRERCAALDHATAISQDRIRRELAALAFSNLGNMTKPDPLDPDARILSFDTWTAEQWAAVEEIKIEEIAQGGKRKYTVKLASKIQALRLLGEHAGLFDPNNPHRIKETSREVIAQNEGTDFKKDTSIATMQEAYSRLLNRNTGTK